MHSTGAYYVGNTQGVVCYRYKLLAQAALTILWQRDGGGRLNYRITTYTGDPVVDTGEVETKLTSEQALKNYCG